MELSNLEAFDYYKHLKNCMKSPETQCKDILSPSSVYCLKCQESSCKNCSFEKHNEHKVVYKLPYYTNEDNVLLKTHFSPLDKLVDKESECLNVSLLRNNLNRLIEEKIGVLSGLLVQIKEFKLKEVATLLDNSEGCVDSVRKSIKKAKDSVIDFIAMSNSFISLTPGFEIINELEIIQKDSYVNTDQSNCSFLMRYDILDSILNKNDQIASLVHEINHSVSNYQSTFKFQIETTKEILEKLLMPTEELFKYPQLTQNFYKELQDKTKAYKELIGTLKKNVFDSVMKNNTFEDIERQNIISDAKNKQRIDSVLNVDCDQYHEHLVTNGTEGGRKKPPKALITSTYSLRTESNASLRSSRISKAQTNKIVYPTVTLENIDEVNINHPCIQKFFSYQMLDLLNKIHNIKKKKQSVETITTIYDDDVDIAKPIPGTNEIQVYDRTNRTMQKRKIQFDKVKHRYTYFLNGCRSVLIKDRLYITGGVDKEKNESNSCYVYLIKSNELKLMQDMIDPRAYHSIEYLEFFKSILVIGGENNASCELYDMYANQWKPLPDLNYPRSNSSIYLDRITNSIYSCFGIIGSYIKQETYSDIIERLELKKANNGWSRLDYVNRTEMDFKNACCKIFPIDYDRILVYGASGIRELKKKSAIFSLKTNEMIKIDSKTYNEMRNNSMQSKKLTDIIAKFI